MGKFVSSKIKLNMPKVNQLNKATIKALEQTVDALKTEVVQAQVIPFDNGDMQTNTFPDYSGSKNGKAKLVTPGPQPRRLFFHPEYNFQTKENAHARGNWYEDWISGKKKDFCKEAFTKFYKKEAGL